MSWFMAPQAPPNFEAQIPDAVVPPQAHIAPRIGLTVGKVLGKATERNRIKRRMRDALRRHVGLLPEGFDLIFHPRRIVLSMEFAQLEAEIVRILQQAGEQARSDASRATKSPVLHAPGTSAP